MHKPIAWNLMTLDGRFDGDEPWQRDFHETVWGDAYRICLAPVVRGSRAPLFKPDRASKPMELLAVHDERFLWISGTAGFWLRIGSWPPMCKS